MLGEDSGLLFSSQSHVRSLSANRAGFCVPGFRMSLCGASDPEESDVKAGLPEGLKGR